jgi:hypothetical protein
METNDATAFLSSFAFLFLVGRPAKFVDEGVTLLNQ